MSFKRVLKYNRWLLLLTTMLFFFLILRVIFQLFNADLIADVTNFKEFVQIYFLGFRYDLLVILLINLPILILLLVNQLIFKSQWFNRFTNWLFIIANSLLALVSIADIPYFRFNNRRATIEVLDIFRDSSSAMPSFLIKYWFFVILTLFLIFFIIKISRNNIPTNQSNSIRNQFVLMVFILFSVVFVFLGFKKLTPKHASLYVNPAHRTLATNTPLTLLYSIFKGQEKLERKSYFSDESLAQYFNIHHNFNTNQPFQQKNIFVFVLESFSQEYLIANHPNKAPTPFLDELISKSIVFENTYANGATSAYGLMSILGGIPPFLDEAYFATIYGDNNIYGIGTLLKEQGYTNNFFYGAEDDHYGFRKNMALLGIDNYFSKEDYKGNAYDGHWGVYDEPFMQMAASKIKEQSKPVFSTIFNISSHLPYMVPDELKAVLPKGTMSSHQSLAYVDYSIEKFFESIETEEWFSNSIFIFIADHWAKRRDLEFKNDVGRYRIPFFIYDASQKEQQKVSYITQQLDVVPTILDYLEYSGPFMSFGKTALPNEIINTYRFSMNEYEDIYQLIDSSFVQAYDETQEKSISLFNYKTDTDLENNLLETFLSDSLKVEDVKTRENYIKAVIQTYNNHLIDNDIDLEPKKLETKK